MANLLTRVKDRALGLSVKAFINREIKEFGAATKVEVDSDAKMIRVQAALKGETSPVAIEARPYELSEENGIAYISFTKATASREWLAVVLNKYVAGQKFEIPPIARRLL